MGSENKNKHGLSRYIDVNTSREVRAECGFGCAICGEIFVELHHFDPPFSDATEHTSAGIIALCQTHHTRAGNGEISLTQIKEARKNPAAKARGYVDDYLMASEQLPTIYLGSNLYAFSNFKLCIDGIPVLWGSGLHGSSNRFINAVFRDENFDDLLVIKENHITKNSNGIPIRKIANRYVIGPENRPILVFEAESSNVFRISTFEGYGIDSPIRAKSGDFEVGNSSAKGNSINLKSNMFLGPVPQPSFGRFPKLIVDKYDPKLTAQPIRNLHGTHVGWQQENRIFGLDCSLKAESADGKMFSRVFGKQDGRIVSEHETILLEKNILWSIGEDPIRSNGLVPIDLIQYITTYCQSPTGIQEYSRACISDFVCSPETLSKVAHCHGFILL